MDIENQIKNQLGNVNAERTYIDKILSREDIKALQELQTRSKLTRKDIDTLQHLMNSAELKLHNLGENQRYVHNKYYCWIEEMLKIYKMYLDYQESEAFKESTDNTKKLYDDTLMILSGVVKQFCFLFFHLSRSSLSLGGWGIGKLLSNVVEYDYKQNSTQTLIEPDKKKFFGLV